MADRTKTTRYALITYGLVLVLPTIVLGLLYWGQLQREFDAQLAAIPEEAQDSARLVVDGMQKDLESLLDDERERPFYMYAVEYAPPLQTGDSLTVLPSDLVDEKRPLGVLAWFTYDRFEESRPPIHVFPRRAPDEQVVDDEPIPHGDPQMLAVLQRFWERKREEGFAERFDGFVNPQLGSVTMAVAAVALWQGRDLDCVRDYYERIRDWDVKLEVTDFSLDFYIEDDGTPRAFATRTVLLYTGRSDLPAGADCLEPIANDVGLAFRQGLVLDADWLFQRRPRAIADRILGKNQRLVDPADVFPIDEESRRFASILPVSDLGFRVRTQDELRHGLLEIEIDTTRLEEARARSIRRFFGVGLMLLVTLMTGMRLVYLNVRRELDQAHRMQNFVAAVTHELRTPLSAIRLHGEMLLDGWASDPEKQRDYYRRILRETERLSTLVERVLEKSRLKEDVVLPQPGDLNELVEAVVPSLEAPEGGTDDLYLQLAEDLPHVMMTREAVAGILSNLIENARKYAPVEPDGEPIRIRTIQEKDRVVLEVADRGPGVPAAEKDRIFEAFYRSGRESTRQTIGTGLGLHLVDLHASSVGGRASVLDRPGGGSVFRVAFKPAP